MVRIEVELSPEQAEAFAQFLKRVGLSDYRDLAQHENESYEMLYAGEKVRAALAEIGFAPR